jgi:pilus assembly protein CpaE
MDGARVALVDLNLQYGDVGMLLHLEAHPTSIAAVVAEGAKVEAEFLGQALAVAPENVHVLLAPSSPELGDLVTAAGLRAILLELSRHHDYIVVDSPAHLEERILAVVDVADQILLVTSFSLTSVKDTKVTLRLLQSLGTDPERVAVVLNQTRAKVGYAADEIERALRFAVLATLPYEPRMEESLDTGRPMVVTEPHSRFSRQLRVIADHLGREGGVALEGKRREPPGRRRMRLGR